MAPLAIPTFRNSGNIGAKQPANIGNEHFPALLSGSQSKANTSSTEEEFDPPWMNWRQVVIVQRGDTITSSIVKKQSKPHAKQLSNTTPTMSILPKVQNLFGM